MRLKKNRDYGRPADPNAYWRRRFFILACGLAMLALFAWLFSGRGPAPSADSSAAARASMAALQARDALPSAAYGSALPGTIPTPSIPVIRTPAARPRPTASASASAGGGPRCAPRDIVLSLFPSQASYSQGARPRFDVYAVSTAATPCWMAYGAGSVRVIVTRHGQVVWDSAACRRPAAGAVRFQRGVPHVLSISWNRKAAGPSGCAGSLPSGAWGTFDAVAMTAGQSSPVRAFKLLS